MTFARFHSFETLSNFTLVLFRKKKMKLKKMEENVP